MVGLLVLELVKLVKERPVWNIFEAIRFYFLFIFSVWQVKNSSSVALILRFLSIPKPSDGFQFTQLSQRQTTETPQLISRPT